ncbi:MAG: hypothetical protein ABIE74_04025 [Pseudomonadota bacterium]
MNIESFPWQFGYNRNRLVVNRGALGEDVPFTYVEQIVSEIAFFLYHLYGLANFETHSDFIYSALTQYHRSTPDNLSPPSSELMARWFFNEEEAAITIEFSEHGLYLNLLPTRLPNNQITMRWMDASGETHRLIRG